VLPQEERAADDTLFTPESYKMPSRHPHLDKKDSAPHATDRCAVAKRLHAGGGEQQPERRSINLIRDKVDPVRDKHDPVREALYALRHTPDAIRDTQYAARDEHDEVCQTLYDTHDNQYEVHDIR
jgi:hypothetical protein